MPKLDTTRLRELFPVCRRVIYLNHAAVSPLATPTRRAMEALIADVNENGALRWQQWIGDLERVRKSLATLIGACPAEIALVKNTSEGLSTIAQGLAWRPGDRIVTFECEFPANLYPWLALRRRGVQVDILPSTALRDLDELRRACCGARLLALSFVQYLSGFRSDLESVGRICRDTGTLFLVDAIQGLGAFPVDVRSCGIHFLAADGHKWLTGPEGAGLLFVDESVLDEVAPLEIGWTSVADWGDFEASSYAATSSVSPIWRPGSARFEPGTLNTVGLLGLGAAVDLLQSVGIESIGAHLLTLNGQLRAGVTRLGFELHSDAGIDDTHRSGIISFRPAQGSAERDATAWVAALLEAGICCANRGGWIRCAPHLYNTSEEVDTLLERLHV